MTNFLIFTFIGGLFIAGLVLTAPTPENVDRCVETTNYTRALCEFELSR